MFAAMMSISADYLHLRNMLFDLSKPVTWEAYIGMFAESGMEVYEIVGTVWVEEEGSGRNVERANIVIRVRESFEQVQQQLYTACEMMDRLNMEDTVQIEGMEEWANHVQATLSTLTSIHAEDIDSVTFSVISLKRFRIYWPYNLASLQCTPQIPPHRQKRKQSSSLRNGKIQLARMSQAIIDPGAGGIGQKLAWEQWEVHQPPRDPAGPFLAA
ncbi:hypothetical protein L211DRAFT_852264 [Terfezia boudieri ATCC MYA-4762]|uniref:Uncharacterized protein n=1 Tax=Terfezia boudieri ATCC MYA-4762 TaxID=1051890 RepID=A0A3N4LFR7_9PEZI|nr:hypothetical protein L211DRAFT_852264 [Terfezia boudieri ATCC MYA-4762]